MAKKKKTAKVKLNGKLKTITFLEFINELFPPEPKKKEANRG